MDEIIDKLEIDMKEVIGKLESRLSNIKAGKANPSLLTKVKVVFYGIENNLQDLATISTPEAREIIIKPYDKNCLPAIEKGIFSANLGMTPNNNGEIITISIPPLTESARLEYVKDAKKYGEDSKIALRTVRQDYNNEIKKSEESEDLKKQLQNEVQDLTNKYNKIIDEVVAKKEKDLLTI